MTLLNARRRLRSTEIEQLRISLNRLLRGANLQWHGVKIGQPDWSMSSLSLALTVEIPDERLTLHLIANAYWEALEFELPQIRRPGMSWRRWINTGLDSPRISFTGKLLHHILHTLCGWNPVGDRFFTEVLSGAAARCGPARSRA